MTTIFETAEAYRVVTTYQSGMRWISRALPLVEAQVLAAQRRGHETQYGGQVQVVADSSEFRAAFAAMEQSAQEEPDA